MTDKKSQLDRSREFGTIYGDDKGRVYEQDGRYFLGTGELWVDGDGAPAPKTRAKPVAEAAKPADPGVDDQLNAQLGA